VSFDANLYRPKTGANAVGTSARRDRQNIRDHRALIHSRETGVGAKDLSGPVGILAMLAKQVNSDYRLALSFLVLPQHQPSRSSICCRFPCSTADTF